jgi:hypothetical protein
VVPALEAAFRPSSPKIAAGAVFRVINPSMGPRLFALGDLLIYDSL